MKPPISLKKLIRLGIEKDYPRDGSMKLSVNQIVTVRFLSPLSLDFATRADSPSLTLEQKIYTRLFDVKEMIDEYFSIEINEEGELVSLPVILPGHAPSLEKLPLCESGASPPPPESADSSTRSSPSNRNLRRLGTRIGMFRIARYRTRILLLSHSFSLSSFSSFSLSILTRW